MISEKITKLLNQQIGHELGAAYKYLAMAFWFEQQGLKVFGRHFHKQSEEERDHAMRIAKFIQDTGGRIELVEQPKPVTQYASARAAVEAALKSEQTVTKQINDLMAAAEGEKDYATCSFLKWFVDEQVEEEASMTDLLQLVDTAGDGNLLQVETRLAQNTS